MARKLITIIVVLFMLTLTVSPINGQAAGLGNKVSEVKTEVSPQVIHSQQNYTSGSIRQFVNVLDVNLNNTYTKLEIGMPNPINSLKTTSAMAKQNTFDGHRVVGAVNASYFLGNGMPANLLAENNEIVNYGILGIHMIAQHKSQLHLVYQNQESYCRLLFYESNFPSEWQKLSY